MLSLCATPIGNLKDITLRVLETLQEAEVIAAEDTRHTRKLLTHYQIKTRLMHYDDHHGPEGLEAILTLLREGRHVALVTDAGMPLISDPGSVLIEACIREKLPFEVLPGAVAFVNAWVMSGLKLDSFSFRGFLPRKEGERRQKLAELKHAREALIFYEAPHRLKKSLLSIRQVLGERRVVLARELTKRYEEVLRLTVSELLDLLDSRECKGEMVLIIAPEESETSELSVRDELKHYLELGMAKNEAVKAVAKGRHLSKQDVYKESIDL